MILPLAARPLLVSPAAMPRALAILGFLLLAAPGAIGADLSFVRVWPRWYDSDQVIRISEYFTGRENLGERTIVHSRADSRTGFYFVVRVKNPGALVSGTKFVVRVILPTGPEPKIFTLPADVPAGGKVYQLGLTGSDWPSRGTYPVAWKLDLVGADGELLATHESFLWAKPE
jgi:hypothetical protein